MTLNKNLLMIDTSNEYLVLAVRNKNGNTVSFKEKIGNKQSEHILPQISSLLGDCRLAVADLELIAYNQGPGSFTGLRIGASVALSLAYSNNCQLLPLPAFAGYLAPMTACDKANTIVTLDARLGQIYVAGYSRDNLATLIPPCLINPEQLFGILQQYQLTPENTAIANNGLLPYPSTFNDVNLSQFTQLQVDYPDGKTWLSVIDSGRYSSCDWNEADLLYLRNKVALNLEEQQQARK